MKYKIKDEVIISNPKIEFDFLKNQIALIVNIKTIDFYNEERAKNEVIQMCKLLFKDYNIQLQTKRTWFVESEFKLNN